MSQERLELALSMLEGSDWRMFEKFAAIFLADEFLEYRSMASPGGDKGRDGEIYIPESDRTVAVQYSVRKDWSQKITATVQRLQETFPEVRELTYATNQVIGPDADELRKSLRERYDIRLDIRDRTWFTERHLRSNSTAQASEELAIAFVDPKLKPIIMKDIVPSAFSSVESKTALMQLALDDKDISSEKSLTKQCFDSLTLSAIPGSSVETAVDEATVLDRVVSLLPAGDERQVRDLTRSALSRLSGKKTDPVVCDGRTKKYHVRHDYRLKQKAHTDNLALSRFKLQEELAIIATSLEGGSIDPPQMRALGESLETALNEAVYAHAEGFANAVYKGDPILLDESVILAAAKGIPVAAHMDEAVLLSTLREVLSSPSEHTSAHLRRLADSYTLFAFLRQTPDVQKVVQRMFSDGKIWMDASAVLPLIAETFIESSPNRTYTNLIDATKDAGIHLHVTNGIAEEIESHLFMCIKYSENRESWHGDPPLIFSAYVASGRDPRSFKSWVREIRGANRPIADVIDYLESQFGISQKDFHYDAPSMDSHLKECIDSYWRSIHEERRARRSHHETSPENLERLISHDVECTLGVLTSRRSEPSNPMGYRTWWLTFDRAALCVGQHLKSNLPHLADTISPGMTPDFLSQYLRLGPVRSSLARNKSIQLPVIVGMSNSAVIPTSLIELAEQIRDENSGMSETRLRREVRDRLDIERMKSGPLMSGGANELRKDVESRIEHSRLS